MGLRPEPTHAELVRVKRRGKIILAIATIVLMVAGWFAYRIFFLVSHIKEAYAAWDTGTLLVEYMKSHDDRWPASWDNLLTVLDTDSGRRLLLRGASAGDVAYARSLRQAVTVDWEFDPAHPDARHPVTRLDGSSFPVLWEDPNEMVMDELQREASTRPSPSP